MNDSDPSEGAKALLEPALALMGIFTAVLILVIPSYKDISGVSWLEFRYDLLVLGTMIGVLLSAILAGISFATYNGIRIARWITTCVFVALLSDTIVITFAIAVYI